MSIRDAILATAGPKPKAYQIEGWGTVYFRTLTVGEILDQQKDVQAGAKEDNRASLARAFCRVLVDENNVCIFDPNVLADIEAVLSLPWQMVRAAMEQANRHNGLAEDAAPKA
jgi:hypothetical protein